MCSYSSNFCVAHSPVNSIRSGALCLQFPVMHPACKVALARYEWLWRGIISDWTELILYKYIFIQSVCSAQAQVLLAYAYVFKNMSLNLVHVSTSHWILRLNPFHICSKNCLSLRGWLIWLLLLSYTSSPPFRKRSFLACQGTCNEFQHYVSETANFEQWRKYFFIKMITIFKELNILKE